MSSGDEFDKLMSSLSEDFGSEIAKDFEGLDKLQARTPKPITTLSHYTASIFKLTHTDELTTGPNGGSAMVDYMGNVVAFQVARQPHEHADEEECDQLEVTGVAVIVNGVTAFVPFRALNEITERIRAFATGELEGEETTW